MKTELEIQRAHDLLVGILVKEVNLGLSIETLQRIRDAASALCWVLGHKHNQSLAKTLATLERLANEAGYVLEQEKP